MIGKVVSASALDRLGDVPEFSTSSRPGQRSFSLAPAVAALIEPAGALAELASTLAGAQIRPVRVLYFDKNPGANWAVPWHQDRTIAVARRVDVEGYGPWSVKSGVPHVEPPEAILRSIVTLRLHLDDCGGDNGPLLVVRGSYRLGRIVASGIQRHVHQNSIEICRTKAGDVVAMRGLTVHASERASQPRRRRVIHVDFSSADLPEGLEWAIDRPTERHPMPGRG